MSRPTGLADIRFSQLGLLLLTNDDGGDDDGPTLCPLFSYRNMRAKLMTFPNFALSALFLSVQNSRNYEVLTKIKLVLWLCDPLKYCQQSLRLTMRR